MLCCFDELLSSREALTYSREKAILYEEIQLVMTNVLMILLYFRESLKLAGPRVARPRG